MNKYSIFGLHFSIPKYWLKAVRKNVMRLFNLRKRQISPVKAEIANLHSSVHKTDQDMNELIGSWCGLCCPECQFPILHQLRLKQQKRQERLEQLEAKLIRDTKRDLK